MNVKTAAVIAGIVACAGLCFAEQGTDAQGSQPAAISTGTAAQTAAPQSESDQVLVATSTAPSGALREDNPNDQPTPTDRP